MSIESQHLLSGADLEDSRSNTSEDRFDTAVRVSYNNPTRRATRQFLSSKYGHYAVLLLVSLDVGCIFAEFLISLHICEKGENVSDGFGKAQDALGIITLVFTCLFMAELLASIGAFGFSYFSSKFHCFDATIIIAGFLIDVCLSGILEEAGSIVVFLRLWRVFKIVEEFSAGASDQMEMMAEKMEKLEVENEEMRNRLRSLKSGSGGSDDNIAGF